MGEDVYYIAGKLLGIAKLDYNGIIKQEF